VSRTVLILLVLLWALILSAAARVLMEAA